jgi:hypothetical protein
MATNRAEFPFNEEDDDDGHVKLMMDNAAVPGQGTRGASSFDADQRVESGKPRESPGQWPEWKQDNDRAYQRYLDKVFKGDDGTGI